MIDLYYWPTPNGWKITIMLAECGLDYRVVPVDIGAGEQFASEFLRVSPNNRIPAIVDRQPSDGGAPVCIFESGAILLYLAERVGKFMPVDLRSRMTVLSWLMWQVGGLGPMAGQNGHFLLYATRKIPYAIERFSQEVSRLYRVLDEQLARAGGFVAGEYSIADIAIFPWVVTHKAQGINLADYPHVAEWFATLRARPAVVAGMDVLRQRRTLNKTASQATNPQP
jgi:GST-like protein